MTTDCFSPEELRGFLLGDLADPQSQRVLSHLETCARCEATVAALDRDSDTLVEGLRKPVTQPEPVSAYRLAAKRAVTCWAETTGELHSMTLPKLRDYELIEPLAQGGMGLVYRGRHTRLNRQVAVKVLPNRLLADTGMVARFEREMQAVGSLRHPAIVQATDGGEVDGIHFLVMELVDGVDGSALIQLCGPLPIADACEIARQTATGMAYAHEHGIIHRDLKPSNLMITPGGEVKVLDLGLARIVGEQWVADELTTVGQLMGTLDYMAPEQLENSHHVDERSDIFALGATLYKMLTSQSPRATAHREPLITKLRRIASESSPPIASLRADLTVELSELIDRMLSPAAADRPPTMQQIAESMASFTANHKLAARVKEATKIRQQQKLQRQASPIEPLHHPLTGNTAVAQAERPPRNRNRWPALIAAGALLLALAMGVVFTIEMASGQLVIETSSPDVEVRILKAGQPYRQLTVNQTAKSLKLWAGDYAIEIVSDADGLQVENGSFTLKRGETWLAKITQRANNAVASQSQPQPNTPTYEGKSLDQWISLLVQERSPKQFYEGTRALTILASGHREREAIDAVLVAMRYQDPNASFKSDSGETMRLSSNAYSFFRRRDHQLVVAAIANELDPFDEANGKFVLSYLTSASYLNDQVSEKLIKVLQRLTRDASPEIRSNALDAFYYVVRGDVAAKQISAALTDTVPTVQFSAARKLVSMKTNVEEVVASLRRLVQSGTMEHRAEAAWLLG